ncbi:MAG: thioredoxin domain-containing protein [Helicobacteraceae bacterium]|nr:thioredoxin domain-containing protein [Helicobacteraceae bacterium]
MLSMWKLLTTTTLLSSALLAQNNDKQIVEYLEANFKNNPNIKSLDIHIVDKTVLETPKDWTGYMMRLDAIVDDKGKERQVSQKMVWFAKDSVLAPDLIDMDTGESLKGMIQPSFKPEFYKKANLLSGDKNSKHRVAIFSDPLCPFCSQFVPKAIEDMKKDPKKFAVYYYHFPLAGLHPAAVELAKAAIVAEQSGRKNVVLDLYKVKINSKERDVKKILEAFNKTLGTKITPSDLEKPSVLKQFNEDQRIAQELMVQGTPTLFFDDKLDKTKRKYEKVQ